MRRIVKAAVKRPSGKVVSRPKPAHHKDIPAHGKRGFIATEPKEFVGRQKAKRIARKAGQANVRGRRGLHSRDIMK